MGEMVPISRAGVGLLPRQALPVVLHLVGSSSSDEANDSGLRSLSQTSGAVGHFMVSRDGYAPIATERTASPGPQDVAEELARCCSALLSPDPIPVTPQFVAGGLRRLLAKNAIRLGLIHGHGAPIAATSALARCLGVPLAVSMLGAERRAASPMKRAQTVAERLLLRGARRIFLYPAFADRESWQRWDPVRCVLVPEVAANAVPVIRPRTPTRGLLTATGLDGWERNGLSEILWAFGIASMRSCDLRLDIVGGGAGRSRDDLRDFIARLGLGNRVRLVGELPSRDLLERLPDYRGAVIPARSERYAMLPLETLFSGVPLLLSRTERLLPSLKGLTFGLTADHGQTDDLAESIRLLDEHSLTYRAAIAGCAATLYERFGPIAAASTYRSAIEAILPRPEVLPC